MRVENCRCGTGRGRRLASVAGGDGRFAAGEAGEAGVFQDASGGFGSSILEICSDEAPEHLHKIIRMAIPDKFSDKYGSQDLLLDYWGLSIKDIFTKMKQALT